MTHARFVAILSFINHLDFEMWTGSGRQTTVDDRWRRTTHAIRDNKPTVTDVQAQLSAVEMVP